MAGGLSQQHGHKNNRKLVLPADKNTLKREKAPEIETSLKGNDKEKGLSQDASDEIENSSLNEAKLKLKADDEKTENDLNRRKIPDSDRVHGNEGHLSPFEGELKDRELTEKKKTREEIHNQEKQPDSFPEENDNENKKRSKQKKHKHSFPQQGNNILMVLAKVGQTSSLAKRFKQCVFSICKHTSVNLSFHILVDEVGKLTCEDTFSQAGKVCKKGLNVTYYDVRKVAGKVRPIIEDIQVRH